MIAFNSDRDKPDAQDTLEVGLYVMNPDGTGVKRLTGLTMTGLHQTWSPNGKCIVYQSGLTFQDWIMLVKMDGTEPVKLVHAGYSPQWSPDGRMLVYTVVRGEWNQDIYTLDLDTLKTTRLTNNQNNDTNPTWKPWKFQASGSRFQVLHARNVPGGTAERGGAEDGAQSG